MGNACPSGFVSLGGGCVYNCNQVQGQFQPTLVGGQPKCVVQSTPSQSFSLTPLGFLPLVSKNGTYVRATLDEAKTLDPTLHAQYVAEETRVKEEVAVLAAAIGKEKLVQDAFKRLQDAENARDRAPDAYQKARNDYYTLLKGESWMTEERERIARAEVDPIVQKYRNEFVSLSAQLTQQQKAYETMRGIKDKVFRVKDDLTYSASLLTKQVDKVRAQITLDRRTRESGEVAPSWYGWVDTLLNVLLVVALVVAIGFVIQKLRQKPAAPPAFTQGTSPP